MEQTIRDIVADVIFKRQNIRLEVFNDSHLQNDLGLDSLDSVLLVFAIEEKFLIKIPKDYNTYQYKTVQDIIDVAYKVKKELYG